jgi:VanZ family protein
MKSHCFIEHATTDRSQPESSRQLRDTIVIFIACVWQIETINDQLKNISQIEHSRHRSLTGFMVNLVGGLIAYTFQPKKPSLGLWRGESGLPVVV